MLLNVVLLTGCAVSGGWMGVEAEKSYSSSPATPAAAAKTAPVVSENNDDYYQVHKDGRILVFSDHEHYKIWQQTGEVPLAVTRIGEGPAGETVVMQLNKSEANSMVKTVGYKGAAQRMYEGELAGSAEGFYGELISDSRIYVFDNADNLASFRGTGHVACGVTQIGVGPASQTVVFAQSCDMASKSKPEMAIKRFRQQYALN